MTASTLARSSTYADRGRMVPGTRRLLIAEHAARIAAEASESRASFLAEASRILATSFDYHTTVATLARLAIPAYADFATVDLVEPDGSARRVGAAHADPSKEAVLHEASEQFGTGPIDFCRLRAINVRREPFLIADITDSMLDVHRADASQWRIVQTLRPRSLVSAPLRAGDRDVGILTLYLADSGRRFGPEDLAFAEELARRAALAVENARLYNEARQATKARDEMLAVVAHDLRNPLHTIAMGASLLSEMMPSSEPVLKRQVEIIKRAGERMNRLIQDLLDLQRVESAGLTVKPAPESPIAIVREAMDILQPLARSSSLVLDSDVDESLPNVMADAARVQQVLSNLVGNAIKFTPAGGRVLVRAGCSEREVRFSVIDTGPGIPAEQIPHIFGRFWQADRGDRRGLGLGLAIAKGIIEAHGGRIWVESLPGAGSAFHFTLPKATRADV